MSQATDLRDESDAETFGRNVDAPIAGIRGEVALIGEDLTRLGHRVPAACPVITDIKLRLTALMTYVRSLETTVAARRQAGKEEAKTRQERPEDYELALAAAARAVPMVPEISAQTRRKMMDTLHRAGDFTLDETDADHHVVISGQEEGSRHGV